MWDATFAISVAHGGYPQKAKRWFGGTRIRFELDASVPLGACHHQKLVVIDDALAFCGSADIVPGRWDTHHHLHHEPRRLLPHFVNHLPRHEVMALVDGAAATALGQVFRDRWRAATDEALPVQPTAPAAPWPSPRPPALSNSQARIARTFPRTGSGAAVTEIHALRLACIAQARRLIFLENQYFTHHELCAALAERLEEPTGPEVVLISTLQSPSWFDRMTMDTARAPLLERLQRADRHGRFRAFGPRTTGGAPILVHSKVAIFDDEVLCVGSANLNHRSEAFDSEVEVAITAADEAGRQGVRELRNELLSHFLEIPLSTLGAEERRNSSLVSALDLSQGARVTPLRSTPTRLETLIASLRLGDPRNVEENWRLAGRLPLGA